MEERLEGGLDNAVEAKTKGKSKIDKKTIKRILTVFLCAVLVGLVLGFGIMSIVLAVGNKRPKDFVVREMTITLTEGFTRQEYPGALGAFGSRKLAVLVRSSKITSLNSNLSANQYAALMAADSDYDPEVMDDDGLSYFVLPFTNEGGARLLHYVYVYKTNSDFWIIQFDVAAKREKKMAEKISDFAHSVRFE